MQHRGLADQGAGQRQRLVALADDADHAAVVQRHRDGCQLQRAVLGQHHLGGAGRGMALGQRGPERDLAEARREAQEVVVVGPALPQAGIGGCCPPAYVGEVREGVTPAGQLDGLAARNLAGERLELVGVVALVSAGAARGVAALLDPAADHEHRTEQHEQRVDDAVQDHHHHRAQDQRPDRRGDAEPGPLGLAGLLGHAQRLIRSARA